MKRGEAYRYLRRYFNTVRAIDDIHLGLCEYECKPLGDKFRKWWKKNNTRKLTYAPQYLRDDGHFPSREERYLWRMILASQFIEETYK